MTQARRAVRLVFLRDLLHERPYTIAQLARLTGVSERTIYRDLCDLQLSPLNVALMVVEGNRWVAFDPRAN